MLRRAPTATTREEAYGDYVGRGRGGDGGARRHARPLRRARSTRMPPRRTRTRSTAPSGSAGPTSAWRSRTADAPASRTTRSSATCRPRRSSTADGSIDWLCFPRFDSGACFAALLGGPENGRWLARARRRRRRARAATSTTRSSSRRPGQTEDGSVARVLDFMPPRGKAPDIVRIVEGVKGRVHFRSELTIRFDYGRIVPWVRKRTHEENTRVALAGPDALCFRTPATTRGEDMRTVSEFTVDEGERVPFVLTWFPSHEDVPEAIDPEQALADTESVLAGVERGVPARASRATGRRSCAARSSCSRRSRTTRPAGSSPRRRRRCRSGSARCATGTTATAGCATRRSRCSPSSTATTPTRRASGGAG